MPGQGQTTLPVEAGMIYFHLLVGLLFCAFLISYIAASHEIDPNEVFLIRYEAIYRIIGERDDPGELAAAFGDCWTYTWEFYDIFKHMIAYRRLRSLKACLLQIVFPDADKRGRFLTSLLRHAVNHGNQDAVEFLLGQTFDIGRAKYISFWGQFLWNAGETKKLVQRHPEHAAGLAPSSADFSHLRKGEDGLLLIELARCCEEIQPGMLDATALLHGLVDSSLGDEGKALVAQELLDMGARVEQRHLDRSTGYDRTKQLLHLYLEFQGKEIKNPGMD
jgi:hypothetical protein